MLRTTVDVPGGALNQARARDALAALSGVTAAESLADGRLVRVWRGDELTDEALEGALARNGISGRVVR